MLWFNTRSTLSHRCCLDFSADLFIQLNLFMLEHPSTPETMTAVIETIHRYSIIWTSMNAVSILTHALYSAHQVSREKGIQSRALLMLLSELDTGRFLDSPSREHVAADFAALAHVSHNIDLTKLFHPDAQIRLCIPSRRHQTMCPMFYPKFCFLPKTPTLTPRPFLLIVYGTSIEQRSTGHGKSGTILLQVFVKSP